jgi:hypothetical protein
LFESLSEHLAETAAARALAAGKGHFKEGGVKKSLCNRRQTIAFYRRAGCSRAGWQEGTKDDHYTHAEGYCMLAPTMAPRRGTVDMVSCGLTRRSPWDFGSRRNW